jgi:AcrR family transcriptional regulator
VVAKLTGPDGKQERLNDPATTLTRVQHPTSRRLMLAALESFSQLGYHGASTRDVATRASMSPAAVYIRFQSKAEMLQEISVAGHTDLLDVLKAASDTGTDPAQRFEHALSALVEWHALHYQLARVLHYEFEALESPARHTVMGIRIEIEDRLRTLVVQAYGQVSLGSDTLNLKLQMMWSTIIDVARWYPAADAASAKELGRSYGNIWVRMLEVITAEQPLAPRS